MHLLSFGANSVRETSYTKHAKHVLSGEENPQESSDSKKESDIETENLASDRNTDSEEDLSDRESLGVVQRLSEPIYNTGRNVTTDDWYTCIPLAKRHLFIENLSMILIKPYLRERRTQLNLPKLTRERLSEILKINDEPGPAGVQILCRSLSAQPPGAARYLPRRPHSPITANRP
ncbi:hypothetical protein EVAR_3344_1 [Eumeta japonica]|uniref:Uncharacterized protein n=1 Tax=Eumeta variegata TaxID=151549 RepID=A0A4C1SS36_EUMVA|nr:hypothetical protein EVAR_3344_1 [Eumeta japonica]